MLVLVLLVSLSQQNPQMLLGCFIGLDTNYHV